MPSKRKPTRAALEREVARLRRENERLETERKRLQKQQDRLKAERERLENQNAHLKRQLDEARRAGKRQAAPFSKGAPKLNPKKPGRRAGKRYGRRGRRKPPSSADEEVDVPLPPSCPDCRGAVVEDGEVFQQFLIEIPEVQPHVTRFDVHCGHCRDCGRGVQGRDPRQTSDARGAAAVSLGPRVLSTAAQLHHGLGLSYGKVAETLRGLFNLPVTRGGICQALARVGTKLQPTYTELQSVLQKAPVVVPDETGWKVAGVLQWLWVFATTELTFYAVFGGRGFEEAAAVLGEDFSGTLVRDGWAPYDKFTEANHQTCFAHLLRRCRENLETADRGAARVPRMVHDLLDEALALRARHQRGVISDHGLAVATGRLAMKIDRLLLWRPTDDENRKLLKHIRNQRHALLTFLCERGIDATNWRAEQAIRPAVVARKVFGGNRTWNGATTHGIILSFLRSASQQGLDATALLTPVIAAREPRIAALRGLARAN